MKQELYLIPTLKFQQIEEKDYINIKLCAEDVRSSCVSASWLDA
jgi:hypothetical protein